MSKLPSPHNDFPTIFIINFFAQFTLFLCCQAVFKLAAWVCWHTYWFQHLAVFTRQPPFLNTFYFTEICVCFFHAVQIKCVSSKERAHRKITTDVTKFHNSGCQFSYCYIQELTKLIVEATLLAVCQLNGNSHNGETDKPDTWESSNSEIKLSL